MSQVEKESIWCQGREIILSGCRSCKYYMRGGGTQKHFTGTIGYCTRYAPPNLQSERFKYRGAFPKLWPEDVDVGCGDRELSDKPYEPGNDPDYL